MSFPFVRAAVAAKRLQVHGWYFDLERGELHGYDSAVGRYVLLANSIGEIAGQTAQRATVDRPGES